MLPYGNWKAVTVWLCLRSFGTAPLLKNAPKQALYAHKPYRTPVTAYALFVRGQENRPLSSLSLDWICLMLSLVGYSGRNDMDYSFLKKRLSNSSVKKLLCYIAIGLLMVGLSRGRSRIAIDSMAVSPDEQYVACFVTGNGYKIHCLNADGSLNFTYNIPTDISSGGHCTLWFDVNILCALFYRTNKIVHFALDGSIMNISDYAGEEYPPEFPSFSQKSRQYVFEGNEITVVYDKASFFGYWLLGAKRSLAFTTKNGETKLVYAWTATGQGDGAVVP